MHKLAKFLILSNPMELGSNHFPSWPEGINKDPTVWPDGARLPPKYIFKNNMSMTNSKI